MALIMDALMEILKKPTIGDVLSEMALFVAPIWVAAFVGLVVGWTWKPRWAAQFVDSKIGFGDSGSLRLDCYPSSSCAKEEKVVELR